MQNNPSRKILFALILTAILLIAVGFSLWSLLRDEEGRDVPDDEPVTQEVSPNAEEESTAKEGELVEEEIANESLPVVFTEQDVPFTSQAPLAEWDDQRQQDGCEEASALMAVMWARGEEVLTTREARSTLLEISDFELKSFGTFRDTDVHDTATRILSGYFDFDDYVIRDDVVLDDIIQVLMQGNIVLLPMDGQKLGNPNFTPPGPDRHMLVVVGYDPTAEEFITNDPGTRNGENYRYAQDVLFGAIRQYPTGDHIALDSTLPQKSMIVIGRP